MLASTKPERIFSRECAVREWATYLSRPTPHPLSIRQLLCSSLAASRTWEFASERSTF